MVEWISVTVTLPRSAQQRDTRRYIEIEMLLRIYWYAGDYDDSENAGVANSLNSTTFLNHCAAFTAAKITRMRNLVHSFYSLFFNSDHVVKPFSDGLALGPTSSPSSASCVVSAVVAVVKFHPRSN